MRLLSLPHPVVVGGTATLTILVYLNAIANGFAIDDVPIILNNSYVHGFGNLRAILLGSYWPDSQELYRPVVLFSFAVDWAISGGHPAWFHGVNIALHAAVTALVYLLLLRLGAAAVAAALGAAVFAVHPVHVEAVANIVGRAEMLATLFFLLACLLHLRRGVRPALRIGGITLCYFLALGAKEIAVTLPPILLLLDFLHEERGVNPRWSWIRHQVPLYATLGVALAAYLGLRMHALGAARGTETVSYLAGISTSERLATAVRLWPEFARLLFWPRDLAWDWGPAVISVVGWSHPMVFVGLLLGASSVVLAVVAWNRQRWISLAVLWFAVTFFLVSQIPFPIGVMLAERHLYLPSVAVSLLAPALVSFLQRVRVPVRVAASAAVTLLLLLGAWRTWDRTPSWASTHSAYMTLGKEHPMSYRASWYAAHLLLDQGQLDRALTLFRRAVDLTNRNFVALNMHYSDALLKAGNHEAADSILRKSIRVAPHAARPYLLLGESLIDRQQFGEAVEVLNRGRELAVDSTEYNVAFAHHVALAYDGMGMLDSALVVRRNAMREGGGQPLYQEWLHLARLYELQGEARRATAALDSARAAAPDSIRSLIRADRAPDLRSPLLRGWGFHTDAGEL
jgi:tetratricopeptide (TPR) repeat protein